MIRTTQKYLASNPPYPLRIAPSGSYSLYMPQVRTMVPDGAQIRARRLRLGLKPGQLAARIGNGRHVQTIRRLEAGRLETASEILMHQVAIALGAEVEDITKGSAA